MIPSALLIRASPASGARGSPEWQAADAKMKYETINIEGFELAHWDARTPTAVMTVIRALRNSTNTDCRVDCFTVDAGADP
jgi:hypothetical protein